MAIRDTYGADHSNEWFTSVEAAAVIGCDRTTLNDRLLDGSVPGRKLASGRWMLDAEGLAIAKSVIHPKPRIRKDCSTCHQIGDVLYHWETGTVAELTPVIGIHDGNVRKHLNHLSVRGLAIRRLDGAWELTERGWEWMAGVAEQMHPTPPDQIYDEMQEGGRRTG
jgi:hypothetical protein